MSELRRLWVDKAIYENHSALLTWLADQDLSRFYVEVARDEHEERVLIDVHPVSDKPLTLAHRSDPLSSSHRCDDLDCRLCVTMARPSGAIPSYSTDAFRQLPEAGSVGWMPIREFTDEDTNYRWVKPLKLEEDTDNIPRIRIPVSPVVLIVWVVSVTLAFIAAFICVRFWYVKYGCPFWPDSGLLSACKALTIHVGKL